MSDKGYAVLILVLIAVIGIGAVVIFSEEECHGMEMANGTCIWLPEGTTVDGEKVGE